MAFPHAFTDATVRVRVPATSANLGPGFDTLGLALAWHDELSASVRPEGLELDVRGEAADDVARDETHLVVRAMRATFGELGEHPPGLAIACTNRIPHARGLGSSAAAIVAGVLLARGLVRDGADRLDAGAVLRLAAALEGHPDNVAPCLLGGLTVSWLTTDDGRRDVRAVRRDPDRAVVPVALVPPGQASTAQARALLPESVPHADAARNAGRAALLVAALTGTPQALFDATEDALHQVYRGPAMPETRTLVAQLRDEKIPAVVSGAGPTVLVLARGDVEVQRVGTLVGAPWQQHVLAVDAEGAVVRIGD